MFEKNPVFCLYQRQNTTTPLTMIVSNIVLFFKG